MRRGGAAGLAYSTRLSAAPKRGKVLTLRYAETRGQELSLALGTRTSGAQCARHRLKLRALSIR